MSGQLRIIRPGPCSLVQDLGRPGSAHLGVARSGAADTLSLRAGNRLVGNEDNAAAIEMTLAGLHASFDTDSTVCLSGAGGDALLLDAHAKAMRRVKLLEPTRIGAGESLRIGPLKGGARGYLCIAGGVCTATELGSRSTHAASGIGGLGGRALDTGDCLPIGTDAARPARRIAPQARERLLAMPLCRELRVTPGPHAELFDQDAMETLVSEAFRVSRAADRVGVRLEGTKIPTLDPGAIDSEPMLAGAIQVTPDGTPIILMPDGPTTGGYPVIGVVIGADLPALGQLRPGDEIRFSAVDLEAALEALRSQREELDTLCPPDAPDRP
ncbi:MAG: biotin-dependent carboxyltransferase family protein [Phycisphaerales bacterium]|nr:biotin-dependent carboxyltransferase family protein [Phycisphaerales bacterium]